jgi:hypothetical protein
MAEPVRTAPMSPPSARGTGRPLPARRSTLGLVALLLVPVVLGLTLLAPWVIGLMQVRLTDVQFISGLFLGETAGMVVVLVLGLVAAITRRGRALGIVAAVLALLLNPFTLSLLLWIVRQFTPQG